MSSLSDDDSGFLILKQFLNIFRGFFKFTIKRRISKKEDGQFVSMRNHFAR